MVFIVILGAERVGHSKPSTNLPDDDESTTLAPDDIGDDSPNAPSGNPSDAPSGNPSDAPSLASDDIGDDSPNAPSGNPSDAPSLAPDDIGDDSPNAPSGNPSDAPSLAPDDIGDDSPNAPAGNPSDAPSLAPGNPSDAPSGDTPDDEGRWTLFPIISSSPETSLMLGGAVLRHFRIPGSTSRMSNGKWPRRSSIAAVGAYSLKNQFFVSIAPNLYFGGETWNVAGSVDALWFPGVFYELGHDSAESSEENYTQRLFSGSVAVTRILLASLRIGVRGQVAHAALTEVEAGGLLDGDQVTGSDGGLLVGLGPTVSWDSRDNDMSPYSGALYQLSVNLFPNAIGSDFDYGMLELDLRRYFEIAPDQVIALQASGQFGWGDVPFQTMAKLGGDSLLRGYFDARHIDVHRIAAQAEYRRPLFWRIGGTAFAGAGRVSDKVANLNPSELKYAGGLGLRYALNAEDRVNLRLDLAATSDSDLNLYISLGEAF